MLLYLVTVSPMVLFLTFCGCYKWRSAKSFLFPLEKIQISYFEKWLTQKSQKCVIKYMHSIRLFNAVLTVHPSSVVRSGENCKKLYFLNYFFCYKKQFRLFEMVLEGAILNNRAGNQISTSDCGVVAYFQSIFAYLHDIDPSDVPPIVFGII